MGGGAGAMMYRYRFTAPDLARVVGGQSLSALASSCVDVDIEGDQLGSLDANMAMRGYERVSNGDPAPTLMRAQDLSDSETTSNVFQPKLSLDVGSLAPGGLASGGYLFSWACEMRVVGGAGTEGVQAQLSVNGTEVHQDSWGLDQWHFFAGAGATDFAVGATPVFGLSFRRIGPGVQTVAMRRARMALVMES